MNARLRVIKLSHRASRFHCCEVISKGVLVDQVLSEQWGQQEEGGGSQPFRMEVKGLELASGSGSGREKVEKNIFQLKKHLSVWMWETGGQDDYEI